jgi:NAD(P)H dehydrogenase (quinone)
LTENGHENTVYELSGKLLTQEELVSVLGTLLRSEVPLQQVDDVNMLIL